MTTETRVTKCENCGVEFGYLAIPVTGTGGETNMSPVPDFCMSCREKGNGDWTLTLPEQVDALRERIDELEVEARRLQTEVVKQNLTATDEKVREAVVAIVDPLYFYRIDRSSAYVRGLLIALQALSPDALAMVERGEIDQLYASFHPEDDDADFR